MCRSARLEKHSKYIQYDETVTKNKLLQIIFISFSTHTYIHTNTRCSPARTQLAYAFWMQQLCFKQLKYKFQRWNIFPQQNIYISPPLHPRTRICLCWCVCVSGPRHFKTQNAFITQLCFYNFLPRYFSESFIVHLCANKKLSCTRTHTHAHTLVATLQRNFHFAFNSSWSVEPNV